MVSKIASQRAFFWRFLLRNPVLKRLSQRIKNDLAASTLSIEIPEITPILGRKSTVRSTAPRLNLLVPSLANEHLFGGIWTALQFFLALKPPALEARIILTDLANYRETPPEPVIDWPIRSANTADTLGGCTIVPLGDHAQQTLAIRENDLFLVTAWWTAYTAQRLLAWQAATFALSTSNPLVYLIQDYEPGFYPWSTRYLLADSTYRYPGPLHAVFNTSLLYQYFVKQGYSFTSQHVFEPTMNAKLGQYLPLLLSSNLPPKKRQLILYGRPGVPRNAFELACLGIQHWCNTDKRAVDWDIISIGEPHLPIPLPGGKTIVSQGKLSIDDYADILSTSSIGISLMCSPHPSYPPLEMAAFGVQVITNTFANKDLGSLKNNIHSLALVTPEALSAQLKTLAAGYPYPPPLASPAGEPSTEAAWLGSSQDTLPFPFINELQQMLGLSS